MKRVAVFLNGKGGAAARLGEERLRAQVGAAFDAAGLKATIELVDGDGIAKAVAAASGVSAVVAGGGDGTISAAAGALVGGTRPLGILALGTLNHFARDLGIPADLGKAASIIAYGHIRRVDVAEVNGRVFINNSSVGAYPYLVKDREAQQRMFGRPKAAAMLVAALHALRRFRHRRLTIRVEGRETPCKSPLVFVGNNEYALAFPGLGARPVVDAGKLCLYVVHGEGTPALLRLAAKSLVGRVSEDRDFDKLTGLMAADILSRDATLPVAIDGEVVRLKTPLKYRARPGALRVLAPK